MTVARETVDAFIAHVLSEDHVGAIRDWYADDAWMQENQEPPRVGRDVLMAHEAASLARVAGVESELLGGPMIDGDQVAIRWRFTFTTRSGRKLAMEEVAWQTWKDGKIQTETFFYDPKQRGG
jgi:hypothetical protein